MLLPLRIQACIPKLTVCLELLNPTFYCTGDSAKVIYRDIGDDVGSELPWHEGIFRVSEVKA